jgi:SagB-type dehydrogenase family enzyme
LSEVVRHIDGVAALPRWHYCLNALRAFGAICYVLREGARAIARLAPIAHTIRMPYLTPASNSRYRLSRFAYLRRDREHFVLDSPLAGAQVELVDARALAMLAALCRPMTARGVAAAARGTSAAAARMFVSLLGGAGMLEDAEPVAVDWDFGELVFHAGAGKRRRELLTPLARNAHQRPTPAIKPAMSGAAIALFRPNVAGLRARDVPFTRVLETRRSLRAYARDPLTAHQLGEFLYRVARVKRMVRARVPNGGRQFTRRPYPSGGARYGLELYPVIGDCQGLSQGMYHYDPIHHRLEALTPLPEDVHNLLHYAAAAAGRAADPQVLIVLTARFRRVTSKYRVIAYALVLKEVGVLMQTMYLVATAMNLAPCALGAGDPELFARLIGSDFYEETSVGEFLLGSRRAPG